MGPAVLEAKIGIVLSVAALVLAAVIQSSILPHLAVLGVKAELVLLLVVAWSIRHGVEEGLIWAFFGGIATDLLSAAPFGVSILAFAGAALLAGSFGPGMRKASILLPLILTPLASIIATLCAALVLALLGQLISWPVVVALVVLPAAVLNSVVMLLVYPIVSLADQRLSVVEWPT